MATTQWMKSKQVHLTETGQEYVEKLMIKNGLMEEGDTLYRRPILVCYIMSMLPYERMFCLKDVDTS